MPLSEHEQRVLAEIERRLYEDDPTFVESVSRSADTRSLGRRLRWAIVGFVLGVIALLGLTFHLAFGVIGFALMLVSVVVGAAAVRTLGAEHARSLGDHVRGAFARRRDDDR